MCRRMARLHRPRNVALPCLPSAHGAAAFRAHQAREALGTEAEGGAGGPKIVRRQVSSAKPLSSACSPSFDHGPVSDMYSAMACANGE